MTDTTEQMFEVFSIPIKKGFDVYAIIKFDLSNRKFWKDQKSSICGFLALPF